MRQITIKQAPGGSRQSSIEQARQPMDVVFGMWGKVVERHSEDHTVDILTDRGMNISRIPVASREWAFDGDTPIGGRDLPPKDAYVFLIMPDGLIERAFVLASGFPRSSKNFKNEFLVKDKEKEALSKVEGGWQKTYDKEKGDTLIEDDNGFTLTVKKSDKIIEMEDWHKNHITIDKNGIKVVDINNNTITLNSNGAEVKDANSNIITMDSSGVLVKDMSGNEVQLTASGATIKTVNGKITGGMLQVTGMVAPKGIGPFCALPFCPVIGLPHAGDTVVGT